MHLLPLGVAGAVIVQTGGVGADFAVAGGGAAAAAQAARLSRTLGTGVAIAARNRWTELRSERIADAALTGLLGDAERDLERLRAAARARHGSSGPFLFGTFGAADIFYAPVVSRFLTYGIGVPGFAQSYMQAIWEHDWMREWIGAAEAEKWVIEQFEQVT